MRTKLRTRAERMLKKTQNCPRGLRIVPLWPTMA